MAMPSAPNSALRKALPRVNCVFCGASPLTKEHVYPRWLRGTFGESEAVRTYRQVARGPVKPSKPTVPFDWTVRSVCRICNGGWMSKLETKVKLLLTPMLLGDAVTLGAEQTRTLAVWVFKTVLMIHEQGRTDTPLIPLRLFRQLYRHGAPPAAVRIWVGALDQPLDANVVATRASAEW